MWARTLTHSSETLKWATYKARHGGRGCPLWSAGAHGPETPSGTAGWESAAGPCWAFLLQEIHKADGAHQQERAFRTVSSLSCVWGSSILQTQLDPQPQWGRASVSFCRGYSQRKATKRKQHGNNEGMGLITCHTRKLSNRGFPLAHAFQWVPVILADTLRGRMTSWNCQEDNLPTSVK